MRITVTAGKGGTGKTTLATNLALALKERYPVQFLDCDVEEPDAHIFLQPELKTQHPVYIKIPEVDESKCSFCGKCVDLCQFNSIAVFGENVLVYPELCHGCGLCSLACPNDAIIEKNNQIGLIETGTSNGFQFLQGKLKVGEPMPTPIIRELKKRIKPNAVVILDSPPGTACPAVEAIYKSDFAILVTEPTPFGLHDLKLAIKVCNNLNVPYGVVINRHGIGDAGVDEYCKQNGISVLMRIPDNRNIAELYADGIPFILEIPEWADQFVNLYKKIGKQIHSQVARN